MNLSALAFGGEEPDGTVTHPHSDDQIIVTFQIQAPGTDLPPGASVLLGFDLAPGVAP